MKKIILLFLHVVISSAVFAQTDTLRRDTSAHDTTGIVLSDSIRIVHDNVPQLTRDTVDITPEGIPAESRGSSHSAARGGGAAANIERIASSVGVSPTGAATYTVPLEMPPGIAGVVPQLALTYNSQSGAGIAGYGWNVSGMSVISRIPSTKFHDDGIVGVNLNLYDKYALDGQRLILKSGTYGTDGAVYQTENYSNIKVVSVGGTSAGPGYFEVYYPDGSYARYGNGSNSKSAADYAITYQENPQGIRINYSYTLTDNCLYISQISYGAKGTGTALNEVDFSYTDAGRNEQAYVGGTEFFRSKVLDNIQVVGNGTGYRTYVLTHDQVTALNYDRLTAIQEYCGDGTKSYDPISFDYSNTNSIIVKTVITNLSLAGLNANNSRVVTADFTGNGSMDFIVHATSNDRLWVFWDPVVNYADTAFGHRVDTDHFTNLFPVSFLNSANKLIQAQGFALVEPSLTVASDVKFEVYSQGTVSPVYRQYTKTWTGSEVADDYYSEATGNYEHNTGLTHEFFSGDFNGDGLTDVVSISRPYTKITYEYLIECPGLEGTGCTMTTRDHEFVDVSNVDFIDLDRRSSTDFVHPAGDLTVSYGSGDKMYAGDFNGDGKTDLLQLSNGILYVYGFDDTYNIYLLWTQSDSRITTTYPPLIGDYNGDGKWDVLIPTGISTSGVYLFALFTSTGTGFIKVEKTYPFASASATVSGHDLYESSLVANDVNGDGKTDILWYETGTHDNAALGTLNLTIFHNEGSSASSAAPDFSTGGTHFENTTLIPHPVPIFLNNDQPNYELSFGILSDDALTLFDYQKDLKKDIQLNTIDQDGITYEIAYSPLKPDQPTDISLYEAANAQVFPYTDIEIAPALHVVNKLGRTFNGNTIQQIFGYKGGVTNTEGLGFLGFSQLTTSNWHEDASDPNRLFTISVNDPQLRGAPLKVFTTKSESVSSTVTDVNVNPPDIVLSTALTAAQTTEATREISLVPGFEADATNGEFVGQITHPDVGIADGGALTDYITRTDYTYNTDLLSSKVFINVPTSTSTKNLLTGTNTLQTFAYDDYYNVNKEAGSFSGAGTKLTEITYGNSASGSYYFGRPLTKKTTLNNGSDTYSSEEQYTYTGFLPTQIKRKGNGTGWMTENLTYDSYGNITAKTTVAPSTASRSISMQYDSSHRFTTQVTDLEGLQANSTYDASTGDLLTLTNPYSQTTTNTYDVWGRLTQSTDYLGKSSYRTYTKSGSDLTVAETDDEGGESSTTLNALGQTTETIAKDVLGQLVGTAYEYDVYDRAIKVSEPTIGGSYTQWNETEFDEYGRVKKSTAYTGKVTDISYSGLSTTADDGTKSVTTTSNALGQTVSTTDPGGTINHTYFANGNLKSSDLGGSTQTIEQDGWGRKTKLTDPSAGVYTYTYNDFGETTQETTPKGTTNYTLDASTGKLTAKTITGDATSMAYTYTYDGTTKLLTASGLTNGDGNDITYTYGYDSDKRLNSTIEDNTYAKFTKTLTYDAFGRVATETNEAKNKSNSVTVSRDITNNYQYGALKSITDNTSGTTLQNVTGLNARGQVTEEYRAGTNLKQTNTYDTYGLLTGLKTNRLSGTPAELMKLNYDFDAQRGNLNSRSNTAFSTTWSESFTYDSQDRLTDFDDNNGSRSQSYDGRGRITGNSRLGTYTYSGNSYQQTGLSSLTPYALYHYQNAPEQLITYNAFKSPVKITETGKEIIDFQYNGDEGRSQMYYGSTDADKFDRPFRSHYSEDGSVEITEDIPNGKTSFVFYLGGDAYDAPAIWKYEQTSSGSTDGLYYLYRDHLGSINLITDASANVVEKRQFDAWGNIVKLEDGAGNPLTSFQILDRGYTGHEHLLGVGLINMNARLYDPVLHRFLSADNYVQDPSNSQNFNRYGYVMNNPLRYTDESGEFWNFILGAAIGVVTNGIGNLTQHQSFFHGAGKAAFMGAVGGGLSSGIGSLAADFGNKFVGAAVQTAGHAFLGGMLSGASGGNFGSGALAGGFSSLASAGTEGLLGGISNDAVRGTSMFAAGTAVGGFASEIGGGSFWDGARDGAITAGLNHVAHMVEGGDDGEILKKFRDQYANDAEIMRMYYEWNFGLGDYDRTFTEGRMVDAMKSSPGVIQARRDFYKSRKTSGRYDFDVKALRDAGLNPVQQFVGTYDYKITVKGGYLRYTLTNTTSFRSYVYHLTPQSWNWVGGPMGNKIQRFIFSEPLRK